VRRLGLEQMTDPEPPADSAWAAVLAPLRGNFDGMEVLLIERAQRPADPWSGQVAFPGGRRDPGDHQLSHTALRELNEEVGLREGDLAGLPRYIGTYPTLSSGLRVAAFAAEVAPTARPPSAVDASEVSAVFWAPVGTFRSPGQRTLETARGRRAVEAVEVDGRIVWGFTLRVLRELDARLSGGDASPSGPRSEPVRPGARAKK
jgi:8-oxo-dGTP pyrophosphatase MutT (NUDIX family)